MRFRLEQALLRATQNPGDPRNAARLRAWQKHQAQQQKQQQADGRAHAEPLDLPDMPMPTVAEATPVTDAAQVRSAAEIEPQSPVQTPAEVPAEPMPAEELSVAERSAPGIASLDWHSSQGVDCLLFMVSGLKLAIPLSLLGGVFPVGDKVTSLFGQAEWSLGIWQGDSEKLTIVDSAALVMPERGLSLAEEGFNYLIQLDKSPWALACQTICDTVTLDADDIKWSGQQRKRPWLAGTVIKEMCALIDVPEMLVLLDSRRSNSSGVSGPPNSAVDS